LAFTLYFAGGREPSRASGDSITMKSPNVTVYGSQTCSDTTKALAFLDEREIAYEYKDVDETPEYNAYVAGLNQGKRVIPTIQIDNEIFINPQLNLLARAFQQAAAERA
jgi:glutaredoxin